MNENRRIVRVTKLRDQGRERDLSDTTPVDRLGMMWQLAVTAWAFKGEPVVSSRLQRQVVRTIRGKR